MWLELTPEIFQGVMNQENLAIGPGTVLLIKRKDMQHIRMLTTIKYLEVRRIILSLGLIMAALRARCGMMERSGSSGSGQRTRKRSQIIIMPH